MSDGLSGADPAVTMADIPCMPKPQFIPSPLPEVKLRDTKRVLQLLDEIRELFERKERDYADQVPLGNIKATRKLGIPAWMGVLVRLCDKQERIINLARRKLTGGGGPAVQDESLVDTLLDQAVYSLICIAMLEQEYEDPRFGG